MPATTAQSYLMPVSFRVRAMVVFILTVFAAYASAQSCLSECVDPTRPCVCVLDPLEADISWTPFGSVEPLPVKIGQPLNIGDQLRGAAGSGIVEVVCPGGSEVKLHGQFHAFIQPPGNDQDCAFDLLAGGVEVVAQAPTEIQAGETAMGSVMTQYAMHVSSDRANQSRIECIVYEGEVSVRYSVGRAFQLGTAGKALWAPGEARPSLTKVAESDIRAAALVYARTDVARLAPDDRNADPRQTRSLLRMLDSAYQTVLSMPRDLQARMQMAALQTDLSNSRQVLYHLDQAEQLQPADGGQRALIAAMKYGAYAQLGETSNARAELEKVREIDPEQYERLRRIDPSRVQLRSADPALLDVRPLAPIELRQGQDPR